MRTAAVALMCAGLAACASAPRMATTPPAATSAPAAVLPARCAGVAYAPAQEDPSKRGDYVAGGLYRPGERDRVPGTIPDVDCIPEPQVVSLERSKLGNRPVYTVLDREYRVLDDTRGFVEEGLASYYGEKFHGRRTSNWEVYDMYAFTAAHKTLPLPSFARVTNLDTGRSVVVRVNDRGPFHDGRVMDLSFAAAVRLGIYPRGTGRVRVEALQPGTAPAVVAGAPASPPRGTLDGGTPLDTLVARLPAQVASAADTPPPRAPAQADASSATPPASYRFEMGRDQRPATADDFADWMQRNGVKVATGQPATARPADAATAAAPASATVPAGPVPDATGDGLVLQVASFASRDNAERAQARLDQAGIGTTRLQAATSGGQTVWRLRVGPVPATASATLIDRLAGLGFGSARPVHD